MKIINAILNIKPEEVFAMFPKMGSAGSSNPARARNNYDVTNIALLCGLDACCQQLRARCIVRIPLVSGDSPDWRYSSLFASDGIPLLFLFRFRQICKVIGHWRRATLQDVAETKESMARWCREELSWYEINGKSYVEFQAEL